MTQAQFDFASIHANVAGAEQHQANPATTQTSGQIRTATISDQKPIIAGMTLAFSSDPAVRWMYPDPDDYLTHFPRFVQAFGGKAFACQSAYWMNHYAGTALWLPPGVEPDADSVMDVIQQTTAASVQADLLAVFEQMGYFHPTEPHWYLALIGVDPTQQGKGYGSALMQQVLRQCDRDRIPAYLEASKPTNVLFYQQHGFELLGTIQVGTSPSIFPMLRQPH